MANLNKGGGYGDFEAPAPYNHGVPNQNNVNHGVPQSSGYNGSGDNDSGYGSQHYGEYVEPEIYEEHYAGANYDGFQNPQPSSGRPQQQRRDDRRYDNNSYGGTRYAEPQRQYSNQQFESAGSSYPYQNQQAFDPQTNMGAGNYTRSQPQPNVMPNYGGQQMQSGQPQKFCKWCASAVAYDAVICPSCGRQIEELKQAQGSMNMGMNMGQPQVIINNNSNNTMPYGYMPEVYGMKDKGIALLLSLFLGWFGAHKFYEGKIGMGILYFFTGGLFGIGNIVDFLVLLGKPKKYLP